MSDNPSSLDDGEHRHVLYVEDHPVNVLLMEALFTKRPATRLLVATTAEAGLRIAAAENLDLLLLDLRLPDGHGTELLKQLRALPGLADVPAVAVTADDTVGVLAAGFCEVWHKPLDMVSTLARLDRLLALPHAAREEAGQAAHFRRNGGRPWRLPPSAIPFPAATPAMADVTRDPVKFAV